MSKSKESAMHALAKRPKLVKAIEKGTDFHKLKDIGQVSGGFIRMLMGAGVVVKGDDRVVTFAKGVKASQLPDASEKAPRGEEKKAKGKKAPKQVEKASKVTKKGKDKGKEGKKAKAASKEAQSESEEAPKKKGKKGPIGKGTEGRVVEETAFAKLLKPVGDIPANHKIKVEKAEGFWWYDDKRMAQSNLKFV